MTTRNDSPTLGALRGLIDNGDVTEQHARRMVFNFIRLCTQKPVVEILCEQIDRTGLTGEFAATVEIIGDLWREEVVRPAEEQEVAEAVQRDRAAHPVPQPTTISVEDEMSRSFLEELEGVPGCSEFDMQASVRLHQVIRDKSEEQERKQAERDRQAAEVPMDTAHGALRRLATRTLLTEEAARGFVVGFLHRESVLEILCRWIDWQNLTDYFQYHSELSDDDYPVAEAHSSNWEHEGF